MTTIQPALANYVDKPATWLITGVAGFIGSNLLETLLDHKQYVIGLDNFATGFQRNLAVVKDLVGEEKWRYFKFIQGDIRDLTLCHQACCSVDFVLHQAALGSVPRSLEDPINTNSTNIDGFLNMLIAGGTPKSNALYTRHLRRLMVTIRAYPKWKMSSVSHCPRMQ